MTASEDRLERLMRELKADLTKRMDELDAKIDTALDFQKVFSGATKILMYVVLLLGGIAAIYAGFHGFLTSAK